MKKIIAVFALIVAANTLTAQTTDADKKLLVKYTTEEVETMKKENPEAYQFALYCTENAFYVGALSKEKVAADPKSFGEIAIDDVKNINFHTLKIALKENEYQAFVIQGKNQLLMIKSIAAIQRELNKK